MLETNLKYRPLWYARSGHIQTVLVGTVCGQRPRYSAHQIEISLDDGERLIAHEEKGVTPLTSDTPIIILVHGLGGDHRSPYLQRLAFALRMRNRRVWRIDLRGCGAGLRLAWRPPNAGRSDDLAAVVREAKARFPDAPIRMVGFSLSGNILLKMLGELGVDSVHDGLDASSIDRAIAVAPPVALARCADNMDRWLRRGYTHYYLKLLEKQVQQRREVWPQWARISQLHQPKTIRQFDAKYTVPLSGFYDTDDYYERASAAPWLPCIKTDTTLIVDRHDPIVPFRTFRDCELNTQSTQVLETRYGGHMGYFGVDVQGRPIRWLEHFLTQLIA